MQLISTITKLEVNKLEGKMEMAAICRNLMPNGVPNYLEVVNYPMISKLIQDNGMPVMHKVMFLLIKDFCNSLNVVRNMNEEQMIEAASMLLDECGNFRIEDYVMMFQMAKRGSLIKIMDRIDLQVISDMLDAFWVKRHDAANKEIDNENKMIDGLGHTERMNERKEFFNEKTGRYEYVTTEQGALEALSGAIWNLKTFLTQKNENNGTD